MGKVRGVGAGILNTLTSPLLIAMGPLLSRNRERTRRDATGDLALNLEQWRHLSLSGMHSVLDLLIANATLPDGRSGLDIACAQGRIAEIGRLGAPAARRVIDANGYLV